MAVAVIHTITQKQCRSVNTWKPKTGHRCVTASEQYITIPNVPSHLCTHICMQRGKCSTINYNHVKRYCQLTSEDCQKFVKDFDFTVTPFSCWAKWVPVAKVMGEFRVQCATDSAKFVGRVVLQTDILLGTYTSKSRYTHVWKVQQNKIRLSSLMGEVLQTQPWCSAHWVPYIPGYPIPVGAVVGGYLGYPSNATYVIRGSGNKGCGYYDPETMGGYIGFSWSMVATDMDILVLQEI